ncbi:MAG: tetratricopeptide repeat protein, partial [Chloroflexota bacterium]
DEPISLERLITLSESALSPAGQQAFITLGCLPPKPATFSLATVQAIADRNSTQLIYELVDYGLLEPAGENRFAMHQTISAYLRKKGPIGAEQRLITHAAALLAQNRKNIPQIEQDYPVIQAAIQAAVQQREVVQLVQIVQRLFAFIEMMGLHEEGDRLVSLLTEIESADPITQTMILMSQGRMALLRQNNKEGEEFLLAAQEIASAANETQLMAEINILLGQIYLKSSKLNAAETAYQAALELAHQLKDADLQANALTCLGLAAQNRGMLDDALPRYRQALALWKDAGFIDSTVMVHFQTSTILQRKGHFAEARKHLEAALDIVRKSKNHWYEGRILNNLAIVYKDEGAWAQAAELYKTAIRLLERGNYIANLIYPWGNLGTLNVLMGDYQIAELYYERVRQVAAERGMRPIEGRALESLAQAKLLQGDIPVGERFAQQGLQLAEDIEDLLLQAMCLYQLGQGALQRKAYGEAAEHFNKTVAIAEQIGKDSLLCEAKGRLAAIYFEQGNLAAAKETIAPILNFLQEQETAVYLPVQHYLVGYNVLTACHEPAAAEKLIVAAKEYVSRQSRQLPDAKMQKLFIDQVPPHKELMSLNTAETVQ